jgi:hypothetical protein
MGLRRCSHCGDSFNSVDSDSSLPQKFCGVFCELDWADRQLALTQDKEWIMDNDHSLNY